MHHHLQIMNTLLKHRGPDGEGIWINDGNKVGFGHRRLKIIDLKTGDQPMIDQSGNVITYNGEIYNYIELRKTLRNSYQFKTTSDTEIILATFQKWGTDCLKHLRGMFSFAIWDASKQRLFCARDRFGIKPFYFSECNDSFYFASEVKAILPFMPEIKTDLEALKDYLYFQLTLDGKTLFHNVQELKPGHFLVLENGTFQVHKYWDVYYNLDFYHTPKYFEERLKFLIEDSIDVHLRSDVSVGVYLSGGIDSGIVSSVASKLKNEKDRMMAFTGKFEFGALYDESKYAEILANKCDLDLHQVSITSQDFLDSIDKVIYHLDYPVAGPGSFPQYIVSQLASKHIKVVLGGQGGDEIFGGYTRYLIAYFEQCIKGAIDNTLHNGNFIVTYESIIPNLVLLQNYKPLLKEFWNAGLFEEIDNRYFRLINRAPSLKEEIKWQELSNYSAFDTFLKIFNGANAGKESYFDKMTHYDFKTLLPGLLHVEDRMSMAHGLESRVPFLDHNIVEFASTIPADVKFKDGTLKRVLIEAMRKDLPNEIADRKDKMGFPVPLNKWLKAELNDFAMDIFGSDNAKSRPYFEIDSIKNSIMSESKFGRKIWGLLSLELWHRNFHDAHYKFKGLLKEKNKSEIINL